MYKYMNTVWLVFVTATGRLSVLYSEERVVQFNESDQTDRMRAENVCTVLYWTACINCFGCRSRQRQSQRPLCACKRCRWRRPRWRCSVAGCRAGGRRALGARCARSRARGRSTPQSSQCAPGEPPERTNNESRGKLCTRLTLQVHMYSTVHQVASQTHALRCAVRCCVIQCSKGSRRRAAQFRFRALWTLLQGARGTRGGSQTAAHKTESTGQCRTIQ